MMSIDKCLTTSFAITTLFFSFQNCSDMGASFEAKNGSHSAYEASSKNPNATYCPSGVIEARMIEGHSIEVCVNKRSSYAYNPTPSTFGAHPGAFSPINFPPPSVQQVVNYTFRNPALNSNRHPAAQINFTDSDSTCTASEYLSLYPDVASNVDLNSSFTVYDHYILYGKSEGRCELQAATEGAPAQNRTCGEYEYLREYPDVASHPDFGRNFSTYDHYISYGQAEGRCQLVGTTVSLQNPTSQSSSHLISANQVSAVNNNASSSCTVTEYLEQNPEVANHPEYGKSFTAYDHFVAYGQAEGRCSLTPPQQVEVLPSNYLIPHLIVAQVTNNVQLEQTITNLYNEERAKEVVALNNPNTACTASAYLQLNPDVANFVQNNPGYSAEQHYQDYGRAEGRCQLQ